MNGVLLIYKGLRAIAIIYNIQTMLILATNEPFYIIWMFKYNGVTKLTNL